MAKFTTVGKGHIHVKKKNGNKAIRLIMDPKAQKAMLSHDWFRGIFIFKSKYEEGSYTVMAPMPDDYEYEELEWKRETQKEIHKKNNPKSKQLTLD